MSDKIKQLIVIRRDLKMRRGKEIAQGAHASMKFLVDLMMESPDAYELTPEMLQWLSGSFIKIVVQVDSEQQLLECYELARNFNIPVSLIEDNGATEFAGVKTKTCIAIGPAYSSALDPLFGNLKLY